MTFAEIERAIGPDIDRIDGFTSIEIEVDDECCMTEDGVEWVRTDALNVRAARVVDGDLVLELGE